MKRSNERRLRKCVVFSLLCHMTLMGVIYLLMTPAAGSPDGDLIAISFESQIESKSGDTAAEKPEVPVFEEHEYEPQTTESAEDIADDVAEDLERDLADDGDEYLKRQKQMVEAKKRRQRQLEEQGREVASSIEKRSRYGTLKSGTFYGVKIHARSVLFVLDVSGSMDIHEARLQLRNAYRSLTSAERFNLVIYSDQASSWQEQVMSATPHNKKLADKWIDAIGKGGGTNIYGALQMAFGIAERKKVESIYFVSDGLPTAGKVTRPLEILKHVKRWNDGVAIHSIGIGPHQDKVFLGQLAEQNNGKYYVR